MNNTTRFWATIEFIRGQRAAIIELTNVTTGEWAGGGRIEIKSSLRSDLYEAGYVHASFNAAAKGGTLDRYTVIS